MPPEGGTRRPLAASYSWGQQGLEAQFAPVFQPGQGITKGALSVRGAVPGLDADGFRAAADDAKRTLVDLHQKRRAYRVRQWRNARDAAERLSSVCVTMIRRRDDSLVFWSVPRIASRVNRSTNSLARG